MNIGEVIKDHRWRQRYSIREMADTIGISKATLSRVENGKNFDGQTMAKLLRFLFDGEPKP
ncbi:HTH_XRE domain containing protein [uncultured Caudovirales phage]|uniref:HTH_XRE domain containing protein n=1 Tax=uncultured Caudovirales phage TaxID=2100421 RepID=A0A6J5T9A9_9CAUD|nr:HTH_XRE domain containing protein [uncultured Caudovirales phage]CAB4211047.1 HTH_XRE domain containing protein [uncultured Caudovirales phage]CAB4223424.1 HTH_XRE domain containing protein [uncultured Caudovirales phage]